MNQLGLDFGEPRPLRRVVWLSNARRAVRALPQGWRGRGEDVRAHIERVVGVPHHTNTFGTLIKLALEEGTLRRTGQRLAMRRRRSHSRSTDMLERT